MIDLDFGPDGTLYYLQHTSGPTPPPFQGPGQVIHVRVNGTTEILANNLDRPTSLLVDDDGTVYVTNHGVTPGAGEVLRLP